MKEKEDLSKFFNAIRSMDHFMENMKRCYEQLLQDAIFKLAKIFGEKAESVYWSYMLHTEGDDPKDNVTYETGIRLSELEEAALNLMKEADDQYIQAKKTLYKAIKILEQYKKTHGK